MRSLKNIIFILILVFGGFTSLAFAEGNDTLFASLRQIGMGGASVAIANDVNALYQNPACLSNIEKFDFDIITVGLEANSDYISKYSTISELFKTKDNDRITQLIKDLSPAKLTTYGNVNALAFAWKGFGFGFFSRDRVAANLYQPSDPYLTLNAFGDTAGMIGVAPQFNIMGFKFSVGGTAKYLFRSILYSNKTGAEDLTYGLSTIVDVVKNSQIPTDSSWLNSSGPSFDIGGLTTFASFLGPKTSIGFLVKNIGASLSGTKRINGVDQRVNVAVPLGVIAGIGSVLTLPPGVIFDNCSIALDYDFVSQYLSVFKKVHLGVEAATMGEFLKVRLGLNQGYFVGGVGLKLWYFHLDYAYNQESIGNSTGVGLFENSYHALSLGIAL